MPNQKPKILLIEDDHFLSKIYQNRLTSEGFEVTIALEGEDGLAKIKSLAPDLILLDLVLPKKDGFEILSEMKMDQRLKKIPVIILSNLGQESDIEKGKALGAIDYLIKTDLPMDEVVKKIKFHLATSQSGKS